MKKPPQPPDKRRRHLSKEDEELWKHTAGTLEPLKRAKSRIHTSQADSEPVPGREATRDKDIRAHAAAVRERLRPALQADPMPAAKSPTDKPPPLNLFDRKAARRLRGGQIEIEARVDLHGLTQNAAHATLTRFLTSCYARGLRWVLVITGKGMPRRRAADHDENEWPSGRTGVLKRNVPVWLSEPDLRAIVVSFMTAAIQHGGEGALYVQLRSPNRGKA